MKEDVFDVIIVGQGLAGSIMAWTLLLNGKTVAVIDNGHSSSASLAAIGIYNPLIIKRLRKSWMALELIGHSKTFFNKIEKELGKKLLFERPIHRIFSNEEEEKIWAEKSGMDAWEPFIGSSEISISKKVFSSGKVKNTGWVDIPLFLELTKSHLRGHAHFVTDQLDYSNIKTDSDIVQYKGLKAKKMVFCEGYKMLDNPYFNKLPLNPVKGEILVIQDPELKLSDILKTSFFISPLGNDTYKVGATFQWDNLNETTSSKARETLLEKIKPFISDKMEVLDQIAGVRPTVKDRRPLIGRHSELKDLYIFNGMGTRGIMLAPYFAQQLHDYIYAEKELFPEVDIQRFN